MKPAVTLGVFGGAAYSLFTLYAMVSGLTYSIWSYVQSALYVLFLAALLRMAVSLIQRRKTLTRVIMAATVASLLFAALYLLMYWISTAFFPDQLYQLPQFANNADYHAYSSPKQYLFTGNNYSKLMNVQLLSWALSVIFQVALAGTMAWAWHEVEELLDPLHHGIR